MNTQRIQPYVKPFLIGAVIGGIIAGLISLFAYGKIKAFPVIATAVVFGVVNSTTKK